MRYNRRNSDQPYRKDQEPPAPEPAFREISHQRSWIHIHHFIWTGLTGYTGFLCLLFSISRRNSKLQIRFAELLFAEGDAFFSLSSGKGENYPVNPVNPV